MSGTLPLVLAGPIVRRVSSSSAAFFVALYEARTVEVQLFDGLATEARTPFARASATPVALGANLHVTVVEVTGLSLRPGKLYSYTMRFTAGGTTASLGSLKLLEGPNRLGYGAEGQLPGFMLPRTPKPAQAADGLGLRFAQASCRKPSGGGPDALPALDWYLARYSADPDHRLQMLFLTGDQIYADDLAQGLLQHIMGLATTLLGWTEKLADGTTTPTTSSVAPGKRHEFLQALKFKSPTAVPEEYNYYVNHLLFFGEWCAMYLLCWSPELWPPDLESLAGTSSDWWPVRFVTGAPDPDEDPIVETRLFGETVARVRRVLANVATYMICDDHDVTDDWYINEAAYEASRATPTGRGILRNALLAYAIFQDWGNQPDHYRAGTLGAQLLDNVRSAGTAGPRINQAGSFACCDEILDLSGQRPATDPSKRMRWDYEIVEKDFRVLMLDTRTWRDYPPPSSDPHGLASRVASGLISDRAVQFQIRDRFQADTAPRLHIVVSAAPVAGFFIVDAGQRAKIVAAELTVGVVGEGGDVLLDNESWGARPEALTRLLDALAINAEDPIIVLAGDVHYAYSETLTHNVAGRDRRVVQLCSSSAKNTLPMIQALSLTDMVVSLATTGHIDDTEFFNALAGLTPDMPWWKQKWPELLQDGAEKLAESAVGVDPQEVLAVVNDLIMEAKEVAPTAANSPESLPGLLALRLAQRLITSADAVASLRSPELDTHEDLRRNTRWSSKPSTSGGPAPVVPSCTILSEAGPLAGVTTWYDAQPAYRKPLLDLLSFLSVGYTNVSVVVVNKSELDHLLLWPVPKDGFSGTYPDPDPWAVTLHHIQ